MKTASYLRDQGRFRFLAIVLAGLVTASAVAVAGPFNYHLIKSVRVGGAGAWDYITLDPGSRRLFITRGNHVMVVNADNGALIGDIRGLQHVHGVALALALAHDRAYISDGGTNTVVVIDRHTLRKLADIRAGESPDGIRYDAFSDRVFAFDGDGGDATAIDATTGRVAGTVTLGGKPEGAATDGDGSIFVNIEDKGELVAFDSRSLRIQRRWSLAPCTEPSGMAIDTAHARIFSGCRNAMMAVSDATAGKVIATVPIGTGVDSNRFDPADRLVFSSNGISGTLTVVRELTPDHYSVIENVPTARSARTMELDPKTHRIYLVPAELDPATATIARPHPRPLAVPDSFRLLILGR